MVLDGVTVNGVSRHRFLVEPKFVFLELIRVRGCRLVSPLLLRFHREAGTFSPVDPS